MNDRHAPTVIIDSITAVGRSADGSVIVCGSHGGRTAAEYAVDLPIRGVVFNDAGIGKENAGIDGLRLLDEFDLPAAAVSHMSARIGDGQDTFDSGVISHVNARAQHFDLVVGMETKAVPVALARAPVSAAARSRSGDERCRLLIDEGRVPVVALDSASAVSSEDASAIVLTGSHGGLVYGRALSVTVRAAFFNDAGFGKESAGIRRVQALDHEGVVGVAVSHLSARIGNGLDTYESGVVSWTNEFATSRGVEVGFSARRAVAVLRGKLEEEDSG